MTGLTDVYRFECYIHGWGQPCVRPLVKVQINLLSREIRKCQELSATVILSFNSPICEKIHSEGISMLVLS